MDFFASQQARDGKGDASVLVGRHSDPIPSRWFWPFNLVLLGLALPAQAQDSARLVELATIEAQPLAVELELSGTLSAERSARLSARVDGLVERVHVDAGDHVQAGQPLLELDAELARLAMLRIGAEREQEQARAEEAGRLLAEARRLAEQRHVARTEVATREADVRLAEAAAAAQRAREREQRELVERHVLKAPFDGVIVRKLTESGEWVARGTPVLELVALDRVRLDVQAPQERYHEIGPDARATVRPDARPELVLPARIAARVPVAQADGARSFLIRILVDDPEHRLLPGSSATAHVELADREGLPLPRMPSDALLRHPDGGYSVFRIERNGETLIARRQPVRIGRRSDGHVEVIEGVEIGQQVVIRGNEALRDGDSVRSGG